VKVIFDGDVPAVAHCHENVDRYVLENPGFRAVRGWVTVPSHGSTVRAAHSVVLAPDGKLFDITPFEDERERSATRFVPHTGDEDNFKKERDFQPLFYCDCPNHAAALAPGADHSASLFESSDEYTSHQDDTDDHQVSSDLEAWPESEHATDFSPSRTQFQS
jgi:hypothetical protein